MQWWCLFNLHTSCVVVWWWGGETIPATPIVGDDGAGGVSEGGGDKEGKNNEGVLLGLLPLLDGPCFNSFWWNSFVNAVSLNVLLCDIGARSVLNKYIN